MSKQPCAGHRWHYLTVSGARWRYCLRCAAREILTTQPGVGS